MILGSFLARRYAQSQPLALSASIVFEQSYGRVDGDSASMAELVALLSAIAGIPIRQDLAMTGSVNQLGEMQAIGGVNDKIEGFFDVCVARGLSGTQGVVIPRANVQHLMLKPEVVSGGMCGALPCLRRRRRGRGARNCSPGCLPGHRWTVTASRPIR
jgi:predicted ATP-dependent protease